MCGRFTLHLDAVILQRIIGAPVPESYHPRYNIAPTQQILTLHRTGDERRLVTLRWGLVPSWSKGPDTRYSMINARSESVHGKPAYRAPFRHHRCLIPASGFYEWQVRDSGGKQPYHIQPVKQSLLMFAALWDHWQGPDGQTIDSCTILTTTANALMAPLHDRMPVILDAAAQTLWLDSDTDPNTLRSLLAPAPDDWLTAHAVGRQVNNPRHDQPDCIERVGG